MRVAASTVAPLPAARVSASFDEAAASVHAGFVVDDLHR